MKPYGVDLRERIAAATAEKGWTRAKAAEVFEVSGRRQTIRGTTERARPRDYEQPATFR